MSVLKKHSFLVAMIAVYSTPSFAFLDGLTSVTNNLIDSTESVTNNTVNNATTTVLSLSSNPGKMADRIGQMADRIGYMGDRIVTTEGLVAGVAHKMLDTSKPSQPVQQQRTWGYAPAPAMAPASHAYNGYGNGYGQAQAAPVQQVNANPYLSYPVPAAPVAPAYGYAKPGNERYSASNMIFGMPGGTYTAARPAPAPIAPAYQPAGNFSGYGYGYAPQPAPAKVSNNCVSAFGYQINCF